MMFRALLLVCLLLTMPAAHAAGRDDHNLLAGGTFGLSFPHPGDAMLTTVPAAGLPGGGEALHVIVTTPASPDYDMASAPYDKALAQGFVLAPEW